MKDSDKKAVAFLLVVGVGALGYFQVMPMFDDYKKQQVEIDRLVGELRVAHRKAENMSGLAGEVDNLKYRLKDLKKILPTEEGSFELIEKLQGLANQSAVKISGISIEDRKEKGEGWNSVGFRIEGSCYWYQFVDFLWKLENYERLIDVMTVSFQPEQLQPGVKVQKFQIVITANVYSSTLQES